MPDFYRIASIIEAQRLRPDFVVLNVTMPVLNGFDAARVIKASLPQTAIVILSTHADKGFIDVAKRIGVEAYVEKSRAGEALVGAVEAAVADGDFVLVD